MLLNSVLSIYENALHRRLDEITIEIPWSIIGFKAHVCLELRYCEKKVRHRYLAKNDNERVTITCIQVCEIKQLCLFDTELLFRVYRCW